MARRETSTVPGQAGQLPRNTQPGQGPKQTARRQVATMAAVIQIPANDPADNRTVGSEQQEALREVIETYTAGTKRWIVVFHGASVRALTEAEEKGVEWANKLRVVVDVITCHAIAKTNLRISADDIGRAIVDVEHNWVPQEFERRMPIAVGAAHWVQPPRPQLDHAPRIGHYIARRPAQTFHHQARQGGTSRTIP